MTLPASASSLPSVQAEDFEGPLDLLLVEVRRQNVDLEKISMAPIVTRFLEYVRTATERNLNLDIEWLHMAATLIHWKSRSLLPPEAVEGRAQDPIRDSLVEQLLAHRKQAAVELARRQALEQTQFSRVEEQVLEGTGPNEPEQFPFVSVWDLMQQARDLSRWVPEHREIRRQFQEALAVATDEVTVTNMIEYLLSRLGPADMTLDGAKLIAEQPTVSRKACLFLGMLELVRDQRLQIEQAEIFGPAWLFRCAPQRQSAGCPET
jgi:chromatin segregation and condensation protein Rec8/ScpA/Scc1 (kleisin family)